jgi:rubrerythrin
VTADTRHTIKRLKAEVNHLRSQLPDRWVCYGCGAAWWRRQHGECPTCRPHKGSSGGAS